MKFGSVPDPENIDFTLPRDHPATKGVLKANKVEGAVPEIFVGCAKWNKSELKNFYPRGTKDELEYYASQFNSIELNASFYRVFPREQFEKWREKTPESFKFFPKVNQSISHFKRLLDTERMVEEYVYSVEALEEKLGMVFLQLHSNFAPKSMDRVEGFLAAWPKRIPLSIEFRHTDWYNDKDVAEALYQVLEKHNVANIITDTAGRRDLLHMRLTSSTAFVRYVGANHPSDYNRLDDWVARLAKWQKAGIRQIYFFIHQNVEKESPMLATYFVERLNKALKCDLIVPKHLGVQQGLF